eukprot:gene18083-22862_t
MSRGDAPDQAAQRLVVGRAAEAAAELELAEERAVRGGCQPGRRARAVDRNAPGDALLRAEAHRAEQAG